MKATELLWKLLWCCLLRSAQRALTFESVDEILCHSKQFSLPYRPSAQSLFLPRSTQHWASWAASLGWQGTPLGENPEQLVTMAAEEAANQRISLVQTNEEDWALVMVMVEFEVTLGMLLVWIKKINKIKFFRALQTQIQHQLRWSTTANSMVQKFCQYCTLLYG